MKKTIILKNKEIEYFIIKNRRARSVKLAIRGQELLVTVPWLIPIWMAERFIIQKADWIMGTIENFKKNIFSLRQEYPLMNYRRDKIKAKKLIKKRLIYYNNFYNFSYNNIRIKNSKTGWGSCSSKQNLNFNYRILYLSPELADYIVVHELCHLQEMNHGREFWKLVAKMFPNYKNHICELKKISFY